MTLGAPAVLWGGMCGGWWPCGTGPAVPPAPGGCCWRCALCGGVGGGMLARGCCMPACGCTTWPAAVTIPGCTGMSKTTRNTEFVCVQKILHVMNCNCLEKSVWSWCKCSVYSIFQHNRFNDIYFKTCKSSTGLVRAGGFSSDVRRSSFYNEIFYRITRKGGLWVESITLLSIYITNKPCLTNACGITLRTLIRWILFPK